MGKTTPLYEKLAKNPENIVIVLRQCDMPFDVLRWQIAEKLKQEDLPALGGGFVHYGTNFPLQCAQLCNATFDAIVGNLQKIIKACPETQDSLYTLAINRNSFP